MKSVGYALSYGLIVMLSFAYSKVFAQECSKLGKDLCISLGDEVVLNGVGYTGAEPLYTNCNAIPVSQNETESSVLFWLYKNGREPRVRIYPHCTGCLSTFQGGKPLVVVSHGFRSGMESDVSTKHLGALARQREDINVIFVDWENLANYGNSNYGQAANNVQPVGKYTGSLLNFIIEKKLTSVDKIHFIGHSLGSHVANFVAKEIKWHGKMARISALDPARPCFTTRSDDEKIDKSDAEFVDVLHTSMLGFWEPCGHADFYVNHANGGISQPGCDLGFQCPHGRAYEFFAESIVRPKSFGACRCGNMIEAFFGLCLCDTGAYMGYNASPAIKGIFWLKTNSESPYGQGKACRIVKTSISLYFVVIFATTFYSRVI